MSREQFAYFMAHALPQSEYQHINTVDEDAIPDVSYEQSLEVYQLYRSGVIIGSDSIGTFNPSSNVTRGAVAAIITRIVNPMLRQNITLEKDVVVNDDENSFLFQDVITLSNSRLNINKRTGVLVTVTYDGEDYPDGISLNAEFDSNIATVQWSDWDEMTIMLTVIPVANGNRSDPAPFLFFEFFVNIS